MTSTRRWPWLFFIGVLLGCGSGDDTSAEDASAVDGISADAASMDAALCDLGAVEAALVAALDQVSTDTDFTLLLRDSNGRGFSHSIGGSTAQTVYDSASTSKWVTAMTILRLVDLGLLSLDDRPQDYLGFWTTDVDSPLSRITLSQLLSFTSGLEQTPVCLSLPGVDFASCVETLHDANLATPVEPGTGFYYAGSHMQVAGLMAVIAAGKSSWTEVFADFQQSTGLFAHGVYDLPSATNPRLAGGMHWRGDEYLDFVDAVYHGTILSPALTAQILSDQIGDIPIVASPAADIGQEWHYGLGFWLECPSPSYDCTGITRISCPGAYGAYPFIDYQRAYFGILARQGALASFPEGWAVFDAVRTEVEAWAACRP